MNDVIALIGNPNCGKTTLFNKLTGTHQKTGNWAGVTTEKKEGKYVKDKKIKIIDLPGLYSLNARSGDERAVLDYLKKQPPKAIINVLDGNCLERSLYLTTEVIELGIPMVIAVNFSDELDKKGVKVNLNMISKRLKTPIFSVSALKNQNLDNLMAYTITNSQTVEKPPITAQNGEVEENLRYDYIKGVLNGTIKKKKNNENSISDKIDKVILNKYLALPIFFTVMTVIYFLSIRIGGRIGEFVSEWFEGSAHKISLVLEYKGVPEWIISLLCGAVIKGIGHILAFLPQILVLFTLLSIMEESGYSARVAFIIDGVLKRIGLSGKSFIPMMLGCGCSVTGIMASRTVEGENEKRMTVFLTPFMPCGVKTAVFGWFSSVFFGGSAILATCMYFLGIMAVVVVGRILKSTKRFSVANAPFIMEIPKLRVPRIKEIFFVLYEKTKEFTVKAGLIIFILSVILWFLRSFGLKGYVGNAVENSFLYFIGNGIKYIFYPLGFKDWQASVALISGVMAKEAVVETFQLLNVDMSAVFLTPYSVYSFCAFVLLSPPCLATLTTAYRELKSAKWTIAMILMQFFTGYSVALIINLLGLLKERANGLILSLIIVIILLTLLILSIKKLRKCKCVSGCKGCKGGKSCLAKEKRYTI